jgi:hypothetical protein
MYLWCMHRSFRSVLFPHRTYTPLPFVWFACVRSVFVTLLHLCARYTSSVVLCSLNGIMSSSGLLPWSFCSTVWMPVLLPMFAMCLPLKLLSTYLCSFRSIYDSSLLFYPPLLNLPYFRCSLYFVWFGFLSLHLLSICSLS